MNEVLRQSLAAMLRPLVKILIRAGVSFAEFSDLAKYVYVDTARAEFHLPGRKQTVARMSMLTGIQRKEISRLLAIPEPQGGNLNASYNRSVRIASGWRRDPEFSQGGEAQPLDDVAFASLVRRYSGDLPARAVLDELIRVGAVIRDAEESLHLAAQGGYVPNADQDAGYNIMGNCVSDLLSTISHNFEARQHQTRLQLTTAYDNLPRHAVERFRHLSHEECVALLGRFDGWLAEHDRDSNSPAATGDAVDATEGDRFRAGIGIYYFEEEVKP